MPSSWQSVYDRAACPACKATTGEPCRRTTGQVGALTSVPHRARRRVAAGLPLFDAEVARAAGWVPLDDVLTALESEAEQQLGRASEPPERAYARGVAYASYFLAERFGAASQPTSNQPVIELTDVLIVQEVSDGR